MPRISFTMTVTPTKRQELLQTLYELGSVMTAEKGFRDARVCLHTTGTTLTFVEDWETGEDIQVYLHSRYFQVLQGAIQLLTETSEMMFESSQPSHR